MKIAYEASIREIDYPSGGIAQSGWPTFAQDSTEARHYRAMDIRSQDGSAMQAFFAEGPGGVEGVVGNVRSGVQVMLLGGFAYVVARGSVRSCPGSPMGYCSMALGSGEVWLALSDGTGLLVVSQEGAFHYEHGLASDNLAPVWIEQSDVVCAGGFDVPHELSLCRYVVSSHQDPERLTITLAPGGSSALGRG